MRDFRSALSIGLAVAVLAAAGCGGGSGTSDTSLPKLIGRVGSADDPDAHEISLQTEDGEEVTTVLPPGRYTLEIDDYSTIHNFHLRGRYGGAEVATEIAGTGKTTVVILLGEPEVYVYACDAHPDTMMETFSIHDPDRTEK